MYQWAWQIGSVFDAATAAKLGGNSWLYMPANATDTVAITLSWQATIAPGDALTVLGGAGIVDRAQLQSTPGGTVVLADPATPVSPLAIVAGPPAVGASCGGAAAKPLVLDASASPPSAGR